MKTLTPNIQKIEIDITYKCTLKCFNCNRGISIAEGGEKENMSVSQISKFIAQSIEKQYLWKQIRIMGGEPTIHPHFDEIVEKLYLYKTNFNQNLELIVSTNGKSKPTKLKLEHLNNMFPDILIENTAKEKEYINNFTLFHVAPKDLDMYDNHTYAGCWATMKNGLGLNFSGFYPCGVGGSIARLFRYDIGLKHISEINIYNLVSMYEQLCSLCGMYHNIRVDPNRIESVLSPAWEKQLELLKKDKLVLNRF